MRKVLALAVLGLVGTLAAGAREAEGRQRAVDPIVIAVVEPRGLNVLHSEFRLAPGRQLRLPAGMPATKEIRLPQGGSFEQRMERVAQGPLGHVNPGTLYRVAGTRIIGIYKPPGTGNTDITHDRFHGTAVSGAAIGTRYGTNPEALLVYITGYNDRAWRWLAEQSWIDVISTSATKVFESSEDKAGACHGAASVREIVRQGRLVFTAAGNGDQYEQLLSPWGMAEAYQVGGVDEHGRSYSWPGKGPTRPYETGDRWSSEVADPDSLDGSIGFGGTSGSAPSTAGRAAELISFARDLLRHEVPDEGPLADGELTGAELTALLHHVATPAESTPGGYLIEGYGSLGSREIGLAKQVLAGTRDEPSREQDDALHQLVEVARHAMFEARQCS